MKKWSFIISVILIFMSLLVGYTTQTENAVLPPARVDNTGVISASLDRSYTFEEAYQEADLVAYVKVEEGNMYYMDCYGFLEKQLMPA